jgi:uncharacterized membrane protein YccF (DUF307 family)
VLSFKKGVKTMKTFGNILWFLLGGLIGAIESFLEGILLCITIIFIPVGLQMFKIGKFFLWPMGKKVVAVNPSGFKTVVNVIWCITGGIIHFLAYGLVGVIFCITIIGIPFGKQYFKLARFILTPLGHDFQ